MVLASGPARRALVHPRRISLGGGGVPSRQAYEWGVRSTRKPEPRPLHRVYEIPGVEPITYAGKMHFVPWLAQPVFPPWDRGWTHPKFRRLPPTHEHPLYKEQPCHIFHQRSRVLEESILLQVHGPSGARLNAKDPLPPIASREEVEATKNHVLETFYPISPVMGLSECNLYDSKDDTGFQEGYPYPSPHTFYFLEKANIRPYRLHPDQLRAKMILFAFGSALTQARLLYGNDAKVLEHPVVVQSVGTDGRVFQFLVLQLNTTDLASSEGIKNLVWMDSDQLLYQHFWCRPVIKKKVVVEPVGPIGFQPETFRKFLALYLHGAV
ncbi:large ribosomal subunit protein mL37 isoform X2 [Erinaceus europaeus]|uniref:Large ribosomal subunit protein mL37 n=1 Tax=Erinaceus europaeus TaxID=9365 RepID=A0ABM3YME0_ERIEU|nr:large ribosomal subunit protein mL37 isoform X2 [Erinaceus europaeus]